MADRSFAQRAKMNLCRNSEPLTLCWSVGWRGKSEFGFIALRVTVELDLGV
jgi:hypothetical protein